MDTPDGDEDPPNDREPRFNESLPDIQDDVVGHPTRKRIAQAVKDYPGRNLTTIAHQVGIRRNALTDHLEILEDWGIIHVFEGVNGENRLLFHADNKHLWEPRRSRVVFSSETKRKVARYIVNNPPSTTRTIAEALGQSPSTTRRHIRELRDDHKLLISIPKGRHHFHHPSDLMIKAIRIFDKDPERDEENNK